MRRYPLIEFTALLIAFANPVRGQVLNYYGSVSFTTGTYIFTERTNNLSFFNGISLTTDHFTVSANLPLILQDTPWISSSGLGMIPSGGTSSSQVGRESAKGKMNLTDTTDYDEIGFGDPLAYVTVRVVSERKSIPEINLTANLKLPLADVDRGFGTGEWDYSFGVSFSKAVARLILFADISYWIVGDMPDLELQNTVAYSLALGHPLDDGKWSIMASLFGNSDTMEQIDPPLQISLSVGRHLSFTAGLTGSIAIGLTESAPDVSISFGWQTGT